MTSDRPPASPEAGQPDFDIEALLAVLEEFPDPRVREATLELLEALMGLHRTGLLRILEIIRNHPAGEDVLRRIREDRVVAPLLVSHDLLDPVPDLEARVRAALDKVRPYMHGHGGDVELEEVRGGRVSLRLAGACHGCGFSENTLRLGIEQTLRTEVPEIEEVVVTGTLGDRGRFLAQATHRSAATAAGTGWLPMASLDEIPEGTLRSVQAPAGAVLLCAAYGRVYAFRDACPDGGGSLGKGTLIAFILKCPCHGHAFDVRSGRCLTRQELALEPLPSTWDNGQLRVAV